MRCSSDICSSCKVCSVHATGKISNLSLRLRCRLLGEKGVRELECWCEVLVVNLTLAKVKALITDGGLSETFSYVLPLVGWSLHCVCRPVVPPNYISNVFPTSASLCHKNPIINCFLQNPSHMIKPCISTRIPCVRRREHREGAQRGSPRPRLASPHLAQPSYFPH